MEAFAIEHLTFTYPERNDPALCDVSLSVEKGAFFVLCGYSGSGKTTLLRHLKPALAPHGDLSGNILFYEKPIGELQDVESASRIGFVMQSPENQIVTDKVWHELAFGLESIGTDSDTIRRRCAEMACFFGMEDLLYKHVSDLSGGQKQILCLASVMTLQPDVLILDEPTARLDPVAANAFLSMLSKINKELGTTVILSEHRLEEALSYATECAVMEKGRILCAGTANEVGQALKAQNSPFFAAMPCAMQVWSAVETELPCPVTIGEGRNFLADYVSTHPLHELPPETKSTPACTPVLTATDLWFRYEKESPDVLKGLDLTVYPGELFCILGGNGAGKTTLLKLLSSVQKPYRGEIKKEGKIALLPQDPTTLFLQKTLYDDFADFLKQQNKRKEEIDSEIKEVSDLCRISDLLSYHPFDLSGGEIQRAALAKLLLLSPDILLLDEPTKGMDVLCKQELSEILSGLKADGKAILMVTHDIEFCAEYADRCGLFFDGTLPVVSTPRSFFSGNHFYTTAANRLARESEPQAITTNDVIAVLGGTPKKPDPHIPKPKSAIPETATPQPAKQKKNLPKRSVAASALILLLIPLTLYLGVVFLDRTQYYLTALAVLLECMLPFFLVFEGRKPKARELAVIATLCGLAVAGRAAFFMLPQFKPVMAFTIIAGVAFGAESGFLVGAVSMLVSNMLFSQGPWTPFQMFAMGITGFLAGILFGKGILRRSRLVLCIFGALSALVIYGGIMNPLTALVWGNEGLNFKVILGYYATGFPMDCVHAAATALFLWFGADPLLEKLDRIKTKYGLLG